MGLTMTTTKRLKAEITRCEALKRHYEGLRGMRIFEVEPAIQSLTYDLILAESALLDGKSSLIDEATDLLGKWVGVHA